MRFTGRLRIPQPSWSALVAPYSGGTNRGRVLSIVIWQDHRVVDLSGKPNAMYQLLSMSFLVYFLMIPNLLKATPSLSDAGNDALVAVHVDGLTDPMVARLGKHVAGQANISIEYTCTWSGIMVIRFTDITAGDRADVITYARRILAEAGIERGVEFLHVHTSSGGNTGKC